MNYRNGNHTTIFDRTDRLFLLQKSGQPAPTRDEPDPRPQTTAEFDGLEWIGPMDETPTDARVCSLAATSSRVGKPEAILELTSLVRVAHKHGARLLNLALPGVAARGPGDPVFARYQDALNHAHDLLKRIRFDAEALGVAIGLEAVLAGCFLSPVEMREVLDAVNSPVIGCCVDVVRIARVGSAVDWLLTLRHRVTSVRLMDALDTNAAAQLREALRSIDYRGAIIVSPDAARTASSLIEP